jgi:hypothetical protein
MERPNNRRHSYAKPAAGFAPVRRDVRSGDNDDAARRDRRDCRQDLGHQWQEIRQTIGGGTQDNDGQIEVNEPLLEREIAVNGDQYVKSGLRLAKQTAILDA